MNKGALLTVIFSALLLSFIAFPLSASAQGPDFIPGRYIVVLDEGVSPQDVIRGHGAVPDFVYSHALNGFSAPISPKLLNDLKQDSRVVHIEQDQKMYASVQTLPTGIDRIDAESASQQSFAGDVRVAIIDTGIDWDHPDLNVVYRVDCAKKGPTNNQCFEGGDDGHGHGTHVAGTVAALDNGAGVVGVVPGADLVAVKVLGNDGSGWNSWVIAGVDYVTSTRTNGDPNDDVDVANMSLGGSKSTALNNAVENSIVAGVVYAVAAGNESDDAENYSPASAPNAITVSAIVDTDGKCNGLGSSTIYGADDTFASFSNYGSRVDIAAPGVYILSTYKDGGYATSSGTSMASPHVAGAAAKFITESTTNQSPSEVLTGLLTNAVDQTQLCNTAIGDSFGGFSENTGDGSSEPLVYVGNTSVGDSPIVTITSPSNPSTFHVNDNIDFAGTASDTEDGDITANLSWTSNIDGPIGSSGSFSTTLSDGSHTITASVTDSHGNVGSDSITVNVLNDAPAVSITDPADGATFDSGATINFAGTASDTEDGDITANLSWTSNIDGSIGSSGSFSTTLSDGSHTITASVTDSHGKTGSASITITVGNPPAEPTTVTVDSITFTTYGGKNNDKHLDTTVSLVDDLGNPVSGASVSIKLENTDTGQSWTGTATTDSTGEAIFSLKNAPSGCYTTTVNDVIATGLTWDGNTTPNQRCK